MSEHKIISGLKEAIAGDVARRYPFITPRAAEEARRHVFNKPTKALTPLERRHAALVAAIERLPVPEAFSAYDRKADTVAKLKQRDRYVRSIIEALADQFEQMRDDAMQEGAKMEEFDSIRAAFNDFASGFSSRAEEIEEER